MRAPCNSQLTGLASSVSYTGSGLTVATSPLARSAASPPDSSLDWLGLSAISSEPDEEPPGYECPFGIQEDVMPNDCPAKFGRNLYSFGPEPDANRLSKFICPARRSPRPERAPDCGSSSKRTRFPRATGLPPSSTRTQNCAPKAPTSLKKSSKPASLPVDVRVSATIAWRMNQHELLAGAERRQKSCQVNEGGTERQSNRTTAGPRRPPGGGRARRRRRG